MKRVLSLLLFALMAPMLYAQSLTGRIVSAGDNKAVDGAVIYCIENKQATSSDENGEFSLHIGSLTELTLISSSVGFERDTTTVNLPQENLILELTPLDSDASVEVVHRQAGNYIARTNIAKTEMISAAGLCKMACCNLAESFENSASVSVGYSDAVTGARQIRLLGLSGAYTTMLDENRPTMRGIMAPFGLSYIPGQWLESIQIAKGASSVINGTEAITGQINLEHRKPTTEEPLFVNLFLSSMLRAEANIASSLQLNDHWSTVMLGHFSNNQTRHDDNGDGFLDDPLMRQYNFANRWLYQAPSGTQLRFGIKAVNDNRIGGQTDYYKEDRLSESVWGSYIENQSYNAYAKLGVPLNADNSKNIAFVADFSHHDMNSVFGQKDYDASQELYFFNAMYLNNINERHSYTLGLSARYDDIDERLYDTWYNASGTETFSAMNILGRREFQGGVYGEYTFRAEDKISLVAGLRGDYSDRYGFLLTPSLNAKYSFTDNLVLRASAGKGHRVPNIIADNLGILSTGREILITEDLDIESAWTYGANLTQYFQIGSGDQSYLSFDYFRTDFQSQTIVDQELNTDQVVIYNLDGKSFTNTYQVDLSISPSDRFSAIATFRYSDSKVHLAGQGLVERPLVSRYKGVLNLQYATALRKWVLDVTAQINGPARLPNFAQTSGEEYSPAYPVLFAQLTRNFRKVELYVGFENILGYKQENPILGADTPFSSVFNSSAIWGPLSGMKYYAGMRFTL